MSKYRGGDTVLVKLKIGKDPRRPGQVLKAQGWFSNLFVDVREEDIVELITREFRRGDEVSWGNGLDQPCSGTIIYIHEGKAWIERGSSMHTVSIADLTLLPKEEVTAKPYDGTNEDLALAHRYFSELEDGCYLRPKHWTAGYICVVNNFLKVYPPHNVKTVGRRLEFTVTKVSELMRVHGNEWLSLEDEPDDD